MWISPPALQEPPPPKALPDRDLSFSGFNDLQLQGSVLAGSDPRWFVVMVAGTGPMDRNWASPQLPKGTAGKDLAVWLQQQGYGSLRYDKRYIGRKRSGLDASLEAQAGDLKSALGLARTLPEAKGRRLLLLAHSEGTLVALMAANQADALVQIAMPGARMADQVKAQVARQLPESQGKVHLDYLEAVFTAIRQGQPRPVKPEGVHPGLERLAQGLMAPETLPFVRETLDLDPWTLLARLPIPVACVWGERDVQALPPTTLPPSFRGTVVRLPETNHLLRRETRPLSEITPSGATTTYGPETPMADLAPLLGWIRNLPR